MQACTFFGHRDCPDTVKPKLREVLADLITNQGVDTFYVGHQGQFDTIVRATLRELKAVYPHINYAVVLAYLGRKTDSTDYTDTILPEGIESVHPRYAIAWRNDWMLKRADYVITYTPDPFGNSARYATKARKQGKHIASITGK